MAGNVSATVGAGILQDGHQGFVIKIQTNTTELNVWIRTDEVSLFKKVRSARWDVRGSVQIGRSAGATVFWSVDDEALSILVGDDDETRDVGLMLPVSVLNQIIEKIQAEQGVAPDR